MYIEDLTKITDDVILSTKLFDEIFAIESEFEKAKILLSIQDRAEKLKKKTEFIKLITAYKKDKKKSDSDKPALREYTNSGLTSFNGGNYQDYNCGMWIANENGICIYFGSNLVEACSHPIMPIRILINAETGICKIVIAFKLKGIWKEIIVDKEIISSASKIVMLSKFGIRVTSENSKTLVKYLSDMEAMNEDYITEQVSTSKLGWIKNEFMPYGKDVVFDNENNLKNMFEAIHEYGDRDKWYELVKQVRKDGKIESKIYLVSSFASILLDIVNALPFVVNLYGTTGKGKTVVMMLAASVWADPSEGKFMTDAKSTANASEIRLNFLNNLPFFIDDMAQIKEQCRDDFSQLVYGWCSGSGKGRLTRTLGMTASLTWKNIIITNAERSLVNETSQGGAINRIIDVEMSEGYLFENGNQVVDVLKSNYGYAGREFVELIQSMDKEEIRVIQKVFYNRIIGRTKILKIEKEEKQMLPMSILLAADYLIEKHLFRDGCILDFDSCVDLLKSKNEVSENERAYQFVIDEIQMNGLKFVRKAEFQPMIECWGMIEDDSNMAIINGNAFKKILERGNFSEKSFLSWLAKKDLIEIGPDNQFKKNKKINGMQARCVFLKLPGYISVDENGFIKIDEENQEDLPFQ